MDGQRNYPDERWYPEERPERPAAAWDAPRPDYRGPAGPAGQPEPEGYRVPEPRGNQQSWGEPRPEPGTGWGEARTEPPAGRYSDAPPAPQAYDAPQAYPAERPTSGSGYDSGATAYQPEPATAGGSVRREAERIPQLKPQRSTGPAPMAPVPPQAEPERPFDPPTSRIPLVSAPQQPQYEQQAPAPAAPQQPYATEVVPPRRPQAEPSADGDGVYRTRRPIVGIGLAVIAAVFSIPALVLLVGALTTKGTTPPSSVVAGTLLLLGLPALAAGMYGLITGAGRAGEKLGARVLLRTPLAYLVIGLTLLLGAALATG
ncbi:hypothetical protein [Longispora albida]|uniref:hypothetical protein n=1 Tax=Longispora albida TaxID=203523 RepID=UPI00039BC6E0|nr:hypothetical protein [Longispora albida]